MAARIRGPPKAFLTHSLLPHLPPDLLHSSPIDISQVKFKLPAAQKPVSQYKPTPKASPYGWINDGSGHATRVPIEDFDYESVFQRADRETPEYVRRKTLPPLEKILSPRELTH